MVYNINKYSHQLLQRTILCFGLTLFLMVPVSAQTVKVSLKANDSHLNPLLVSSFKKPIKANPLLAEFIKPSKHELMYWPNYPLTAAQVEVRDREWDRKYNRPLGQQIVADIVDTYINAILYGKKQVVAVRPRF